MKNLTPLTTKTLDYLQENNINPIKFSEWLNYIKTENKRRYMTSLTLTTTKN